MRSILFVLAATTAHAEAPTIVVDIAPMHSIVSRLMDGIAEPVLLLPPGANAHDYALRPSDAQNLAQADIVIWMGPDMTPWLEGPIASLATEATVITLLDLPGTNLLPWRDPALMDDAEHNDHEDHDEHDEHDEHDDDHAEDNHEGHDHGDNDPHAWLHPGIMYAWLNPINDALGQIDPDNSASYTSATGLVQNDLAELHGRILSQLYPLRASGTQFAVAHDALQYFETAMGVKPAIALGLSREGVTGPAHLRHLRDEIGGMGIDCILLDPFSDEASVDIVIDGKDIPTAQIDPQAGTLTPGPDLYATMLQGLADEMLGCVTPE